MLYFDNSATTQCYTEVADIITKYCTTSYYNPSALYGAALAIAQDIKVARIEIASILSCKDKEIIFTSSGTESNTTVFEGIRIPKDGRVIISSVEHSAVSAAAARLASKGAEVVICPTDRHGRVELNALKELISPTTYLVSIMHVCNETGAINDIKAISTMIKRLAPKAIFHSDGVQACGKVMINLNYLGVDVYSISAHKFHGAKGVGALYIKETVRIKPLLVGGGQERGMRSATENVGGIVSMAYALKRANTDFYSDRIRSLRDNLAEEIVKIDDKIIINTDINMSAPHILSIAMPNSRSEVLLHMLEQDGVIVGTGSACSSSARHKPLQAALSVPPEYSMGLLRFSLSHATTSDDIKQLVSIFNKNYRILAEKLK